MSTPRSFDGSTQDWLDGNTEPFAPVFDIPESRTDFAWRPRASREESATRMRPSRSTHGRVYLIATMIALAAIGVSTAWAIDSANYGSKSQAVAQAEAAAPKKATKHKKHKKAKKTKKKSSAKKTSSSSSS
jgi:hypothetical protein